MFHGLQSPVTLCTVKETLATMAACRIGDQFKLRIKAMQLGIHDGNISPVIVI